MITLRRQLKTQILKIHDLLLPQALPRFVFRERQALLKKEISLLVQPKPGLARKLLGMVMFWVRPWRISLATTSRTGIR